MENVIYSINGPVVSVKGRTDLQMTEMVFVGNQRLIGEVINRYSGLRGNLRIKTGRSRLPDRVPSLHNSRPRNTQQYF